MLGRLSACAYVDFVSKSEKKIHGNRKALPVVGVLGNNTLMREFVSTFIFLTEKCGK